MYILALIEILVHFFPYFIFYFIFFSFFFFVFSFRFLKTKHDYLYHEAISLTFASSSISFLITGSSVPLPHMVSLTSPIIIALSSSQCMAKFNQHSPSIENYNSFVIDTFLLFKK